MARQPGNPRDVRSGEQVYERPPLRELYLHPKTGELMYGLDWDGQVWRYRPVDRSKVGSAACWTRVSSRSKDATRRYPAYPKPRKGLHDR